MFNRNNIILASALFMALGVRPAIARDTTAAELTKLGESIAVLTAKQKKLELESQIAQKQGDLARVNGGTVDLPVVLGIEGVDGKLVARLAFSRGSEQSVKTGEKIRGGFAIAQITVSEVVLARGNEKVHLPFGTEQPTGARSTGASAQLLPNGR